MTNTKGQTQFIRAVCAALMSIVTPAFSAQPIAVVVSAQSPVGPMTAEQLSQVFTSKATSLPGGSSAILIDQVDGSPLRDEFYNKLAGKNPSQMKALWARLAFSGSAQPPKVAGGDTDVKKAVAATPGAIGYIDKSAVDGSVKVLLIVE